MARNSEADPNSIKSVSRHGGVIASAYDVSTSDGMNQKGLVANLLWLAESGYPKPGTTKPGLALSLWAQHYSFASFWKVGSGNPNPCHSEPKAPRTFFGLEPARYKSVAIAKS
jgi:choloylglycine hydrolase